MFDLIDIPENTKQEKQTIEPSEHEKRLRVFEEAACKKGYNFKRDPIDNRYEDRFLQEAWEIFSLMPRSDLKVI